MPCYRPIGAVQPVPGSPPQLLGPAAALTQLHKRTYGYIELPCQKCTGCIRRQAQTWAMRCVHEAQTHAYNSYITLTYDDAHLPAYHNLVHRDWQLFMKKLRHQAHRQLREGPTTLAIQQPHLKAAWQGMGRGGTADAGTLKQNRAARSTVEEEPHPDIWTAVRLLNAPPQIRFYMAGEYGPKHGRPHYHALLFGVDFNDKLYHGRTKAGEKIYTSETLAALWNKGYSSIGAVTFASAAYIARYALKKRLEDKNDETGKTYEIIDLETGEIWYKNKEYNRMSRAQGIGHTWLERYHPDVYTQDKVITKNGREFRPPRYYDKKFEKWNPERMEQIKAEREQLALSQKQHHTPERLAVQEEVAEAHARFQTRNLD